MKRSKGALLVRAMAYDLVEAYTRSAAEQGSLPSIITSGATCRCEETLDRACKIWVRWYSIHGTEGTDVQVVKMPGRLVVRLSSATKEKEDAKSEE